MSKRSVWVEFSGLVALQMETRRATVFLLSGSNPEHIPVLSVPLSDINAVRSPGVVEYPRAVRAGVIEETCLFPLTGRTLTLDAPESADYDEPQILSLREAYNLGNGKGQYQLVAAPADRAAARVELRGGVIQSDATEPFRTGVVAFTTNHKDPNERRGSARPVHNLVEWCGSVEPILRLVGNGVPDCEIVLKEVASAAQVAIYALPSSPRAVDSDLAHFRAFYDLLVTPPPQRVYPYIPSRGGPIFDGYPRCIPPSRID
jgi:hypothetical protein